MEKHRLLRVKELEIYPDCISYIVEYWTFSHGWVTYTFDDIYMGSMMMVFDQKAEAVEFAEQHTKESFSFIRICLQ